MEIRTFTNFWNMERKLYSIYDINLPMPISLKVVGAFLLVGIPWWALMAFLHIPFGDFFVFWVLPPILLGFMASKPWFQKKTLAEFLLSQVNYYRQPKRLAGFRAIDYEFDKKYRFITKVFKRNSKDN
jgi:hypothetical protein